MSQPSPIGPIVQLLDRNRPVSNKSTLEFRDWHTFRIVSPNGGNAGRWCGEMTRGRWTFKADQSVAVFFYIEEDDDAMLFKLTWGGAL